MSASQVDINLIQWDQPKNLTRSTESAKVLVVDDNVDLLKLISIRLKPMKFELKTVTSAEEALSVLSVWRADLVITDLQMPGMSGMELFAHLHERDPLLPVIILTAHGTIPDAVEATQSGVASYLTKPFDSDNLLQQVQLALLSSGFVGGTEAEPNSLLAKDDWRKNIVSKSALMEALLRQVEQLAESDVQFVFEGEPGTGKEELARAVHKRSNRANQPFVSMTCASSAPDLLTMELFGCIGEGSFEQPERLGLLQQAEGGTLLVSDFDEAPVELLTKLLTALIEKTAIAVDGEIPYEVDVRGIATTTVVGQYQMNNKSLWDLSAKLEISSFLLPPLRDRREDIPLIIKQYISQFDEQSDVQFSNRALQVLIAADWPGNVRHLVNVVKECVRLTKTKIISEALVKSRVSSKLFEIQPLTNAHRDFERNYLIDVLKVTNGNVTKAANLAKRNRTEFHRLLNKHKIEAKSFRQ